MQRVPAKARAVFFYFDLLNSAGNLDFGSVIQITGFRTLEPDVFSVFLGHVTPSNLTANHSLKMVGQRPSLQIDQDCPS